MYELQGSQAKRSHCPSQSSDLGAGSLYVFSSKIIQMVSRGLRSRAFAGRTPFAIRFRILLTPCRKPTKWAGKILREKSHMRAHLEQNFKNIIISSNFIFELL